LHSENFEQHKKKKMKVAVCRLRKPAFCFFLFFAPVEADVVDLLRAEQVVNVVVRTTLAKRLPITYLLRPMLVV
jgi:hypothetical protein